MPTYEYNCLKCGKTFEVFQPMKDAPLKTCTCGQNGKVKRLPGRGAGIIFKGSGFYETDYRRRSVKSESARTESGKEGAPREGGAPAPAPGSPPSSPPSTTPSKE
jgi:putative FmdB family regulatory protein